MSIYINVFHVPRHQYDALQGEVQRAEKTTTEWKEIMLGDLRITVFPEDEIDREAKISDERRLVHKHIAPVGVSS